MAKSNITIAQDERSYFDGGYWAYIGYSLLVGFVCIITLGIALPWMLCMFQRWKAKHTVICGKRMYFDGTGLQLIGNYLLWMLLSVITFGIYGLWTSINIRKWITKHTHYQGEADSNSFFDGGVLGLVGTGLLKILVTPIPVVGPAWASIIQLKWESRHTVIDSRRHIFTGGIGSLWVKTLLWGFLTVITLGIYGLFVPVKYLRWETENKIDNEHTPEALMRRSEYRSKVHADAATFKACQVEDDMECVKAGITDAMPEAELLALANNGVRSAQYTYAVRCSQGQYTQEPYRAMLTAAAQAGYAPAISLYLQAISDADEASAAAMMDTAAGRGQVWALKSKMIRQGLAGLAKAKSNAALPYLQDAIYYADVLAELQPDAISENQEMLSQCAKVIRKLQTQTPPSSTGKTIAAVIGVVLGILLLLGAVVAILANIRIPCNIRPNLPGSNAVLGGMAASNGIASDMVGSIGGNEVAGDSDMLAGAVSGNGGSSSAGGGLFAGVIEGIVGNESQAEPTVATSLPTENVSDFWTRFSQAMAVDNCVLTQEDIASDGTIKYALTCDYWYWKSLHYVEVKDTPDGLVSLRLSGVRIYEPDSPDPTMNQIQWESIIRVIYKELDLGDYEGITPYTGSGSQTETYGNWIFRYDNTDQDVSLTVSRA